jgi:hypothetical protein
MADVTIDHFALARLVVAASSLRALNDSADSDLYAACEDAAAALEAETLAAADMTAIGTALGLRTQPRSREEDLDDAIGAAITVINAEL